MSIPRDNLACSPARLLWGDRELRENYNAE